MKEPKIKGWRFIKLLPAIAGKKSINKKETAK
jgi:hypothetical protein